MTRVENIMAHRRIYHVLEAALLLLLVAQESSCVGFLDSLQFTRDAFRGLSRGSERTVDILTPQIKPSVQKKHTVISKGKPGGGPHKGSPGPDLEWRKTKVTKVTTKVRPVAPVPTVRATAELPNPTVITYEKRRKTYRPRASPSNKFLEAVNDIERAVANARAAGSRYNKFHLRRLRQLLEKAIKGRRYKFAREVLGQILYLLKTKPTSADRHKRSSQNAGNTFLQDLRLSLGAPTFDSFMAVQGDVSLIFVIDDTGSMGDEIDATKNISIEIINYPRQNPVEYILSPFNDPLAAFSSSVVKSDTEAGEFVQAINDLTPHDGGDCPELAFRGMLDAMSLEPLMSSPMFVFTDAGPKDATEENILEMKDYVNNFGIVVNFFTSGYCHSKGVQDPRNLHPAFRELAELTGGQALLLRNGKELEQLSGLVGGGLEGTNVISMGSNLSNRKRRNAVGASQHVFPVDDTVEKMTISVSTVNTATGSDITLADPNGAVVSSGNVTLSQVSVYQITNPAEGDWTLVVPRHTGGHEFFVKSSSDTSVDFEFYFMIPIYKRRRDRTEVPVSNAVIGKVNQLIVTVAAANKVNSHSLGLELINKNGDHIREVTIQSPDRVHYTTSLIPPTTPFKLKLKGTTRKGKAFERISRKTVEPSTAVLRGKYASNSYSLPLNSLTFIRFQLCNFGPTEYFRTTVAKDKFGYITRSGRDRWNVMTNRCVTISFRGRATRPEHVNKIDTVFIIAKGESSGTTVAQSMRLLVINSL